mmetsp:Transcript_39346/g.95582  ORF Transcript_39346/g.95582 Transcript_39346/m.95582 type:complete len:417 (+) Transcript_39346:22-1272(+)
MIDLRTGHPRRLPHRALASACRGAAARLDTASEDSFPLQYEPSCFGTPRFVHALAQFLSEAHGVRIFENNLMATNGVSHGVDLCVSAMSTPGDLVLVEEPTYFLVRQIFLDHNLEVHGVRGDADGLDTAELERLLASGEMRPPRLVYVVPSHGNPSGISLSPSRRAHLVRLALRYDFLILSDDVYELLGWAEPTPRLIEYDPKYKQQLAAAGAEPSLSSAPSEPADVYAYPAAAQPKQHEVDVGVVVSIGSFTKILAPGLRLGWLEASPALLQQIRARGYVVSGGGMAPFTGEIVAELLVNGEQMRHIRQLREDLEAGCTALCNELQAAGCFEFTRPQGGYFCWVRLPDPIQATALRPKAEQRGMVFLPGPICTPTANPLSYESYVRLCFAYCNVEDIAEGVRRLSACVRSEQVGA